MTGETIGFELVAARRRAGLTQFEVARRMGTSQAAISRAEAGVNKPSLDFLERFANAAGQTIRIEFGGHPMASPDLRRRRVRSVLGDYVFDPWERDPTPAEQRSLEADGLTRERFKRKKTAR